MSKSVNGIATIEEARTKLYYSVSPSCNLLLKKAITKSEVTSLGGSVPASYTNDLCVKYSDISRNNTTWYYRGELTEELDVTQANVPNTVSRRDAEDDKWDTYPEGGCGKMRYKYYKKLPAVKHLYSFEEDNVPNITGQFLESPTAHDEYPGQWMSLRWISNCTLIEPKDGFAHHPELLTVVSSSDEDALVSTGFFNDAHGAITKLLYLNQADHLGNCLFAHANNFLEFPNSNLYALMKSGQKFTLVYTSTINPHTFDHSSTPLRAWYGITQDENCLDQRAVPIGQEGVLKEFFLYGFPDPVTTGPSITSFEIKAGITFEEKPVFVKLYDLHVYTVYDPYDQLYYWYFTFIKTPGDFFEGAYYLHNWCIWNVLNGALSLDDINFEYTRYDSTLNPAIGFWDLKYVPKGICDTSAIYSVGVSEGNEFGEWPSVSLDSKLFPQLFLLSNVSRTYWQTDFCIPEALHPIRIQKGQLIGIQDLCLSYVRSPLTFATLEHDTTRTRLSIDNSSYVADSIMKYSMSVYDPPIPQSDECYIVFSCPPGLDSIIYALRDIFSTNIDPSEWSPLLLDLNHNLYVGIPESLLFDHRVKESFRSELNISNAPRGIEVVLPIFGKILEKVFEDKTIPNTYKFFIYYKTHYYYYQIDDFDA